MPRKLRKTWLVPAVMGGSLLMAGVTVGEPLQQLKPALRGVRGPGGRRYSDQ